MKAKEKQMIDDLISGKLDPRKIDIRDCKTKSPTHKQIVSSMKNAAKRREQRKDARHGPKISIGLNKVRAEFQKQAIDFAKRHGGTEQDGLDLFNRAEPTFMDMVMKRLRAHNRR